MNTVAIFIGLVFDFEPKLVIMELSIAETNC